MGRELWPVLYRTVRAVGRDFRQKYAQIPGWVPVPTLLWAAPHDRPVARACDPARWGASRPHRPPSDSAVGRRIGTVAVGLSWRAAGRRLREQSAGHPALAAFPDGEPPPVGGAPEDPGARYGRAAGGYEPHAIRARRAAPGAREVTPVSAAEIAVGGRPARQLDAGGYPPADGDCDRPVRPGVRARGPDDHPGARRGDRAGAPVPQPARGGGST